MRAASSAMRSGPPRVDVLLGVARPRQRTAGRLRVLAAQRVSRLPQQQRDLLEEVRGLVARALACVRWGDEGHDHCGRGAHERVGRAGERTIRHRRRHRDDVDRLDAQLGHEDRTGVHHHAQAHRQEQHDHQLPQAATEDLDEELTEQHAQDGSAADLHRPPQPPVQHRPDPHDRSDCCEEGHRVPQDVDAERVGHRRCDGELEDLPEVQAQAPGTHARAIADDQARCRRPPAHPLAVRHTATLATRGPDGRVHCAAPSARRPAVRCWRG